MKMLDESPDAWERVVTEPIMDDPTKLRRVVRSAGLVAATVALAVLGCKQEADATAEPSREPTSPATVAPNEPAAAAPAAAAAAKRFDEASFTLSIEPVGSYAAGKAGEVKIVLDAKGGYKCNDKYPYKFKAKETPGIQFAAPVVKKDAVALAGKRATMPVAFTPKTSGKKTIAGKFSFSVCTEERCLVEKRDLSVDIAVD